MTGLPLHTVLVLREPPADPDYAYREVEVTGRFDLGADSGGIELVLASVNHFAPNFCLAEDAIHRAGYAPDIEASKALAAKRASAEAAVAAERAATIPLLPWEVEA